MVVSRFVLGVWSWSGPALGPAIGRAELDPRRAMGGRKEAANRLVAIERRLASPGLPGLPATGRPAPSARAVASAPGCGQARRGPRQGNRTTPLDEPMMSIRSSFPLGRPAPVSTPVVARAPPWDPSRARYTDRRRASCEYRRGSGPGPGRVRRLAPRGRCSGPAPWMGSSPPTRERSRADPTGPSTIGSPRPLHGTSP